MALCLRVVFWSASSHNPKPAYIEDPTLLKESAYMFLHE